MRNGSNSQRKDDEEMENIITEKEEEEITKEEERMTKKKKEMVITKKEEMVITKEKEKVIMEEQVARSPGLRLEAQLPAWPEASHASNVTAINWSLMIVCVCVAEIITSFYVKDCQQLLSL